LLLDPSARGPQIVQRRLKIPGSTIPSASYFPRLWAPFGRNTYTLVQQYFKVIRHLCCCKQTVYRVSESAFFLFFRQANGGCCSWSIATEF